MTLSQEQPGYPGQKQKTLYAEKLRGTRRRRRPARKTGPGKGRVLLWVGVGFVVVVLLAVQLL